MSEATSIMQAGLKAHLAEQLGATAGEWREKADGTPLPFTILRIDEQPVRGAVTFVTAGLSEAGLHFPGGATTRQELVFSCYSRFARENIPGLIAAVALDCANTHHALMRGQVLGPAGPIFPQVGMEALYASLPVYFPDSFARCEATSPPTHFMWLLPITRGEAKFVTTAGWSRFEDLLVEQDPDLLDLARAEVQLA